MHIETASFNNFCLFLWQSQGFLNDTKPVVQCFQEHFSRQGECLGVPSSQQAVHAAWFGSCSCELLKGQVSKREQISLWSEMAPVERWKWQKVKAAGPINPETLQETQRQSIQSSTPSRLGSHLWPDSGPCHKINNGCTFKRYPSISNWTGHWRERIHIAGFVKIQLLPNVSLHPLGFLTWSCCGIFSGGSAVRKMLLQFFGWWEVSLPHSHKLSKNLPNSQISPNLLNTAKARQEDLQVSERKGRCACLFWHVHTCDMNTDGAFL